MGVGVDRISELPESILQDQILSRLPTQCAVSTSILSKRWRWLWTGVSALEFEHYTSEGSRSAENTMFMNFVDNVLLHHQISNLRSFKLTWYHSYAPERIRLWITTVARNTLHELDIYIIDTDSSAIPMSVYLCQSLLRLKIASCRGFSLLPTSISLPSLTTLELSHLDFEDENMMQHFLSSLPSLKHLSMCCCSYYNFQKLEISSPSLDRLRIECAHFEPYEHSSPRIKICAPQLRYLHCEILSARREYTVSNMPLLQEACIDESDYHNEGLTILGVYRNAHNLLKNLVNVKKFRVHACLLKSLPREDLMRRCLPFLTNLAYLQVFFPCNGCDTLSVLQIMPNLEYLFFDRAYTSGADELFPYVGEMLPQCFRSRIMEIKINEYNGSPEDSRIIIFLLNSIPALKLISFTNSRDGWGNPVNIIRLRRDYLYSKPSFEASTYHDEE